MAPTLTLHDLRRKAKDIINHQDGRLGVLGTAKVRLEALELGVAALRGVFGLYGRELAAGYYFSLGFYFHKEGRGDAYPWERSQRLQTLREIYIVFCGEI